MSSAHREEPGLDIYKLVTSTMANTLLQQRPCTPRLHYYITTLLYTLVVSWWILVPCVVGQCVEECDCTTRPGESSCTVATVWGGIPDGLSPTITVLSITCALGGEVTSLTGLTRYTRLMRFAIEQCNTPTLGERKFDGLASLDFLKVDYNSVLNSITKNTFAGLPNLRTLQITNTNLNTLSSNLFSNLPRLQSLLLSDNAITTLTINSFSGLPLLQQVYLKNNQITKIPQQLFAIPSVTIVYLENNQITTIGVQAFTGASLATLQLQNNQIAVLDTANFSPQIQRLYLQNNNIQYLTPEFVSHFINLEIMHLYGNPLHCNCEMLWLRFLLFEEREKYSGEGTGQNVACATPTVRVLEAIEIENYICEPVNIILSSQPTGQLVCTGTGDPAPTVTWSVDSADVQTTEPSSDRTVHSTISTLSTSKLQQLGSGLYTCRGSNTQGTHQQQSSHVHVPPPVTLPPQPSTDRPTPDYYTADENKEFTKMQLILTGIACFFGALTLCAIIGCICLCRRRNKPHQKNKNSLTGDERSRNKYKRKQQKGGGGLGNRSSSLGDVSGRNNFIEHPQVATYKTMGGSMRGFPGAGAAVTLGGMAGASSNSTSNIQSSSTISTHLDEVSTSTTPLDGVRITTPMSAIAVASVGGVSNGGAVSNIPAAKNYNTIRSDIYESLDAYTKDPSRDDQQAEYTDLPSPGEKSVQNVAINFGHEKPFSASGASVTYT